MIFARLTALAAFAGIVSVANSADPAPTHVPPSLFKLSDPDLEISVWAASPMLKNPTNMDTDQHGRIWVAEGVNYRSQSKHQPAGDRILVLEDTDGDGKADKSWTFVQEPFLLAPMGICVIDNKVIVSMTPDLIVYTDVNRNAKQSLERPRSVTWKNTPSASDLAGQRAGRSPSGAGLRRSDPRRARVRAGAGRPPSARTRRAR